MGTAETRFGAKIRAVVESQDLRLSEVATRCNVDRDVVQEAINDRYVTPDNRYKIAIGLGITVEHERITDELRSRFLRQVNIVQANNLDRLDEALREVWQAGFDCATKLADDAVRATQYGVGKNVVDHLRRNGGMISPPRADLVTFYDAQTLLDFVKRHGKLRPKCWNMPQNMMFGGWCEVREHVWHESPGTGSCSPAIAGAKEALKRYGHEWEIVQ